MTFESPQSPKEDKQAKESLLRHDLIQKEFRQLLENSEYLLPENTDAIMVLSAPPNAEGADFSDEKERSPENVTRIQLAIDVYKKIAAKKLNKTMEQLTEEDYKNAILPFLVLNGETEQLPMMKKVLVDEHFPIEKVLEIDCGKRGIANTKTQFEVTKDDPTLGKLSHLTLVTTAYHVPRLTRTASTNLPEEMDFDVIGVPLENLQFDVYKKVKGEVKRIIQYSAKGDIAEKPREKKR